MLGTLSFQLPHVEQSKTVQFQFTVRTPSGQELARNTLDVLALPAAGRNPRYRQPVAVIAHSPSGGLSTASLSEPDTALGTTMTAPPDAIPQDTLEDESRGRWYSHTGPATPLHALGYRTTRRLTADIKVAVTNYPTADLLHWVRAGGDLLVINNQGASPFFWAQGRGGV